MNFIIDVLMWEKGNVEIDVSEILFQTARVEFCGFIFQFMQYPLIFIEFIQIYMTSICIHGNCTRFL